MTCTISTPPARPGSSWTSSLSAKPSSTSSPHPRVQGTPRRVTRQRRIRAWQTRRQHRPADFHWRRRARRRYRDALAQCRCDAPTRLILPRQNRVGNGNACHDGSASYGFDIAWDLEPVAPAYVSEGASHRVDRHFLAPGADAVKSLLQQCRHESTITYDPNIRPALLGSHAEAKSIFEDLVHLTDVVKLSDEDAQWLYPRKIWRTPPRISWGWAPGWQSSPKAHRFAACHSCDTAQRPISEFPGR